MVASRRLSGITLVELLVAMTVTTLVIAIASLAYARFSGDWDGRLGRFEDARADYQGLSMLLEALSGGLAWVVRDAGGEPGFYFLGREEGMTMVTLSPIFADGYPAVIRVFRERQEDEAGELRWKLVYEEASLREQALRDAGQRLPFEARMVLARDLGELSFEYYGWPSLESRLMADDDPQARKAWFSEYDGLQTRQQPERLRLRIDGGSAVLNLPAQGREVLNQFTVSE